MVPSNRPAISASSTCTSPRNTPVCVTESSAAWIIWLSTVPSTTRRSASETVPWSEMPRPTTSVRRSSGSGFGASVRPAAPPGRAAAPTGAAPGGLGGGPIGAAPAALSGALPAGRKVGIATSASRVAATATPPALPASGEPSSFLRPKIDMVKTPESIPWT